ncbi:hypothetical protein [Thiovibrio frasassiensis]|uniref:Uncharacterized protein n=1 Tax=Thiovibrio frasassiensis TaxID=2984131 RepID=A0A9X4RMZ8_9BACT|nr:hypothetical protein [Thiovibrio frasassiensis]MDG4476723.1 hypothetical protein [Thiovibrio frasassiensis]
MFLNPWSLALTLCSLVVLGLGAVAGKTAVRVLRFWEPGSDSNQQIRLENEIWLSSTLVAYGLGLQIITLILFVLAADQFCQVIVGAMCATGALLANPYGMPALLVKLFGVFFYGLWILLHQLDIRSEQYPLVRIKYLTLLLLLPMLILDVALQTLYIAGIKPDIITSCCAVVFSESTGGGTNLLSGYSPQGLLVAFIVSIIGLVILGRGLLERWQPWLAGLYAAGWLWFFGLSLVVITTVISSYVYAMPYHKCPFCILKPEYHYFGFALYGTLIPATFFGASAAFAGLVRGKGGLAGVVERYQQLAMKLSLFLLLLFSGLSFYHYLKYLIGGGEG